MENLPIEKDQQLWREAQRRAGFKRHLFTYLVMQVFFWALWLMTSDGYDGSRPWPLKVALGWGIGLLFHGLNVYFLQRDNLAEKEYEKLKNKQ